MHESMHGRHAGSVLAQLVVAPGPRPNRPSSSSQASSPMVAASWAANVALVAYLPFLAPSVALTA